MPGIIYLVLAMFTGSRISGALLPDDGKDASAAFWAHLAVSFGAGTLVLTWAVYFLAWLFHTAAGAGNPLLPANILVLGAAAVWAAAGILHGRKTRRSGTAKQLHGRPGRGETVFFLVLLVFFTAIMFFVFHAKDGRLFSGLTVFSDYAPHTAMIRSFSHENNYPTQYPHFGGQDVKYHFMFQFLAGNLEYLGLRIDAAYNLISILSLEGLFIMLYVLARRLGIGLKGAVFASVFVIFRSGTAFFRFILEHHQAGDLWQTLRTNTSFIGYTPNENWGLWNFNVYLNQRHLAFGMLIAAAAVYCFTGWIAPRTGRETGFFRRLFLSGEAWRSRDLSAALLAGTLLGLTAFWNGAAVIGGLLILAGMAVFSRGKLDYLAAALVSVFFSFLQTRIFISGNAVSPSFYFGFIAEDRTLPGILWFLVQISGFYFLGVWAACLCLKKQARIMTAAFMLPVVFAFCVSLTPDVTVNEKYIMIAYAFLALIWGGLAEKLFSGGWLKALAGVVLVLCLTLTGVYDFVIILRDNDADHRIGVRLDSEVCRWLNENLDADDLMLTPMYSMSEVTLSGCMMYCGWPYYAWSAGYDTYTRGERQKLMYTTDRPEILQNLLQEEGITCIIYENGMDLDGQPCREDVIASVCPLAFDNGVIHIYRTGV